MNSKIADSQSSSLGLTNVMSEEEEPEGEKCGLTPPKASKLTREEAGRTTWRFMHMMANNVKEPEFDRLVQTVHSVSILFPCPTCARDFRNILKRYPWDKNQYKHPKYWVCALHNVVNKKLDKSIQFNCDDDSLDAEYGMPSCY